MVFVSHIHIAHTASDPAVKRRNLVDGVFVRQLDIIKYIPCAQAGRKAFRAVPFRIDDLVRAVAQQQLGMHVPRGLGDHARRAHLLEHGGDQQAAGEVRPDADKTEIEVLYAKRAQRVFIGAIGNLRAGHLVGQRTDRRLVAINNHHLIIEAHEFSAQMAAKAPQTDNQNGLHCKLLFWGFAPNLTKNLRFLDFPLRCRFAIADEETVT